MATESVKFLNSKCLLQASIIARRDIVEGSNDLRVKGYGDYLLGQLGRMFGEKIMESKAEVSLDRDPTTGDYVRHAEVYVLSISDARKLYDMIREEVREELGR